MCSVYGAVKVSQKYSAIKLMALFVFVIVLAELFKEADAFSEVSYFYFFQELSCLPPCNGTSVREDVVSPYRSALAQGIGGGERNVANINDYQGFPCDI
ncbi:hypothetical protein PS684_01279 [Pseudomonas fluorescens]|jgi:hypothetical protein|nr:hypothetical protein PS681_00358 [Pseudomonas fluorescens]VVN53223.1 hypothetical protein PS684_01279 [Pseudomonas fluorescens]